MLIIATGIIKVLSSSVIPAKVGMTLEPIDSCLHGNDNLNSRAGMTMQALESMPVKKQVFYITYVYLLLHYYNNKKIIKSFSEISFEKMLQLKRILFLQRKVFQLLALLV